MSHYARSIAVVLSLALMPAAWANGFSSRGGRPSFSNDPGPAVCVIYAVPCVIIPPPCIPQTGSIPVSEQPAAGAPTTPAQRSYATPTAAPPSTTPPPLVEPPPTTKPSVPGERPPAVSESASYFDTYAVAPRSGSRPTGDRCTVGFWNLSDRDITVKVDGQPHTVVRGKSLPLEVGREFVWQVEGRDPQKEQIATGEVALEIVIRR